MRTVLIASTKTPAKGKENEFIASLKEAATHYGCEITALYGCKGPGCYNYALKVSGERWEEMANGITMALMPSRWCETAGEFDGFSLTELD